MAKKAKPKSKRTQVKDLRVAQQELTVEETSKIKGGTSRRVMDCEGYAALNERVLGRPASTNQIKG